jgi:hypothetical protein
VLAVWATKYASSSEMNFKHAYILFMIASLLLTAGLVVLYVRRGWCAAAPNTFKEGFESSKEPQGEAIKMGLAALTNKLYETIGRIEKFKAKTGDEFLKERIGFANMSITDLARAQLNKADE